MYISGEIALSNTSLLSSVTEKLKMVRKQNKGQQQTDNNRNEQRPA